MSGYEATVELDIDARPAAVWDMLTSRASAVWFGAKVTSDWKPGSSITWAGEWEGKAFEDHGEVKAADVPSRLIYTHVSPTSPDDVHTLTFRLTPVGAGTHLELVQDGNASQESADHSRGNLRTMLDAVKAGAEG